MFPGLTEYSSIGLFILRLAVGIIFIYHAWPKMKDPKSMAAGMGTSSGAVLLLGVVEMVSAVGLIFGLYAQLAALLLTIVMVGAISMKIGKWNMRFSMQSATGWEFDVALLAGNLAILLTGGGSIGIGY